MQKCFQTEGLNMLDHGNKVWHYTKKLISGDWQGMKIPDWLRENHVFLVNNLHDPEIIKYYNIYHDCGKHICKTIDDSGKVHYYNHAEISSNTFRSHFSEFDFKYKDSIDIICKLIKNDMCIHTETADEINNKEWSIKDYFTLLITSLAEIHANSDMFGGIDSTSFKIKFKKIKSRGNLICKKFVKQLEHNYTYVITRNDLKYNQKTVQSIHAAIESFNNNDYEHYSVISILVKNESKLKKVIEELIERGIKVSIFREPDMENEITAVATAPLTGHSRNYLKKFQLL